MCREDLLCLESGPSTIKDLVASWARMFTLSSTSSTILSSTAGRGCQRFSDLASALDCCSMCDRVEMWVQTSLCSSREVANITMERPSIFCFLAYAGSNFVDSTRIFRAPGLILVEQPTFIANLILFPLTFSPSCWLFEHPHASILLSKSEFIIVKIQVRMHTFCTR